MTEMICAGFGGQGVLTTGLIIAHAAMRLGKEITWYPSYGSEMRGGTANCALIVNRGTIGSPIVDSNCDLLIVLNRPSLEKYLPELADNGILLYDSSTIKDIPALKPGQKAYALNGADIAEEYGNLKCANAVMLGALAAVLKKNYLSAADSAAFDQTAFDGFAECFSGKEKIVKMNSEAYKLGQDAMAKTL